MVLDVLEATYPTQTYFGNLFPQDISTCLSSYLFVTVTRYVDMWRPCKVAARKRGHLGRGLKWIAERNGCGREVHSNFSAS